MIVDDREVLPTQEEQMAWTQYRQAVVDMTRSSYT